MPKPPTCVSCSGSGEVPTDYGSVDCPDCGGAGYLPSRGVLVEWRSRDLEKSLQREDPVSPQDARWLLDELRVARAALTEIIALAHDVAGDEALALRIRMTAAKALSLYEVAVPASPRDEAVGH